MPRQILTWPLRSDLLNATRHCCKSQHKNDNPAIINSLMLLVKKDKQTEKFFETTFKGKGTLNLMDVSPKFQECMYIKVKPECL